MPPNPSCALLGWLKRLHIHREPSSPGQAALLCSASGLSLPQRVLALASGHDWKIGKITFQGSCQLEGDGSWGIKTPASIQMILRLVVWALGGSLCCTHSSRLTDILQQGPSFPLLLSVLPRVTSQVSSLYLNPISDLALREPRHNTERSVFLPHL